MKAALLIIGDEILYGHTIDTNSAFLGRQLTEIGHEPVYKAVVGDDIEAAADSILRLCERYNLIIATGGLGPTHDDVTKKAICRAFKRNLVLYEDVLKYIEDFYRRRNREMPSVAQSQALLPQGCHVLENEWGTAPGMMIRHDDSIFISLPGVPYEMKNLFIHRLKSQLSSLSEGKTITFRRIKTFGIVEAALFEMMKDLLGPNEPVKVAFLPGYSGVDIRLTVKDRTREEADRLMAEFEAKLMSLIGDYVFAEGDVSMVEIAAELLKKTKRTLSTAESCTGGLLSKMLTDLSGSSEYFERGAVTYSNRAKAEILGVPPEMIEKHGAVSEEVARAMAEGMRKLASTDYALSITGIAGPTGGTPEKPVGTTFIGLASEDGTIVEKYNFLTDRDINRNRAATAALNMLRIKINKDLVK